MAAFTGKTNPRYFVVKIDDSVPTARTVVGVKDIGEVGLVYAEKNTTSYNDGSVNYTLGQPVADLDFTGELDNTADTGLYTVCKDILGSMLITHTVEVEFGIRKAPEATDPQFDGEYYCSKLTINGSGDLSTRFVQAGIVASAFDAVPA
jgi:hypothetical protein